MAHDNVEEDPSSRFVDYTNETDWERFISALESTFIEWGLSEKGTVPIPDCPKIHLLSYLDRYYLLLLHKEDPCSATEENMMMAWHEKRYSHFTPTLLSMLDHRSDFSIKGTMQTFFGADAYLILFQYPALYGQTSTNPDDISIDHTLGVMESDAKLLLSSLVVALGNINCTLPAFVPIGDLDRQVFIGAAVPGSLGHISLQFETNTTPDVPPAFTRLSSIMGFFQMKLESTTEILSSDQHDHHQQQKHQYHIPSVDTTLPYGLTAAVAYDYHWTPPSNHPLSSSSTIASSWRKITSDILHASNGYFKLPLLWGPLDAPLKSMTLQVRWPCLEEGTIILSCSSVSLAASDGWTYDNDTDDSNDKDDNHFRDMS
jgi:hypothetical protein